MQTFGWPIARYVPTPYSVYYLHLDLQMDLQMSAIQLAAAFATCRVAAYRIDYCLLLAPLIAPNCVQVV